MSNNKYYLFAGSNYYPSGGVDDFIKILEPGDNFRELFLDKQDLELWNEISFTVDWIHIADENMKKIFELDIETDKNFEEQFDNFVKSTVK